MNLPMLAVDSNIEVSEQEQTAWMEQRKLTHTRLDRQIKHTESKKAKRRRRIAGMVEAEFQAAIFWYIEVFYRRKRPHEANGHRTPERGHTTVVSSTGV